MMMKLRLLLTKKKKCQLRRNGFTFIPASTSIPLVGANKVKKKKKKEKKSKVLLYYAQPKAITEQNKDIAITVFLFLLIQSRQCFAC